MINSLSLPYECDLDSCGCHNPDHDSADLWVGIRRDGPGTYRARVIRDGMTVDELRSHDVTELVRQIHAEYPRARRASPAGKSPDNGGHHDGD